MRQRFKWTKEAVEVVRRHYPTTSTADIMAMLPGSNYGGITRKAYDLGLRRTAEYRRAYLFENRKAAIKAITGKRPHNYIGTFPVVCVVCGSTFEVSRARKDTAKMCSRECAHEAKRQITGTDHPLYTHQLATCKGCGKQFKVKRCRAESTTHAVCCSRGCAGAYATRIQGGRVSSLERAVEKQLLRMGLRYEAQHRVGPWTCDFYLPDYGLIVECDGDYWHSRPEVIARDRRKDKALAKAGYRLARIRECDVRQSARRAVAEALGAFLEGE